MGRGTTWRYHIRLSARNITRMPANGMHQQKQNKEVYLKKPSHPQIEGMIIVSRRSPKVGSIVASSDHPVRERTSRSAHCFLYPSISPTETFVPRALLGINPLSTPITVMEGNRAVQLAGVTISGFLVSLVVVCLRFWVRIKIVRKLGMDDWFALISFVSFIRWLHVMTRLTESVSHARCFWSTWLCLHLWFRATRRYSLFR